ncbi:MAG: Ger(x)C family spore germination protein [Clostridiales bacterium]|nr:Ger(x)C family spore germination protein [Clostridiales bacterium]
MRTKCLFLVLIPLLFSGCRHTMEMEDRNFVITMGIDKTKDGNLMITAETASQEENERTKMIYGEGVTLYEAMNQPENAQNKTIYFGQMKAAVLGQNLLEDGILTERVLNSLEDNSDVSLRLLLLATDGEAREVVEQLGKEGGSSGLFLWDFYQGNAESVGHADRMELNRFLNRYRKENNGVLPLLKVKEDQLLFDGSAVMENNQFCGYLSSEEEKGVLLAEGRGYGVILAGKTQEAFTVEIGKNQGKFRFYEKGGQPYCELTVKADGILRGAELNQSVQKAAEQALENAVYSAYQKGLTLNADVLQLEERMEKYGGGITGDSIKLIVKTKLILKVE